MSAIPIKPRTLARGLASGQYRESDLGIEKRCTRCGEFWPVDDEFFSVQREPGGARASAYCRACFIEKYQRGRGMRGAQPASDRAQMEQK